MKNILIIDDDTFMCQLLGKQLQNSGFNTEAAFSGSTGMELFKRQKFDLVLCDFRLPDSSGMDLLQQMHSLQPGLPVVIITAYADVRMAVKLMKLGASDYITKPVQQEELLDLINQLLKRKDKSAGSRKSKPLSQEFIVGESPRIQQLIELATRVAPTDMSVIIEGETGTGKEYLARYLHENSNRNNKPFLAIDCGAIPRELANSELFGHVKGSFTGAISDKAGVFQKADGGTLFLDEVGNLSYDIQLKLLRAIQERMVSRLGEEKPRKIDIRIIAASNENLLEQVEQNNFREDLYHRLNEFKLHLPGLRERDNDLLIFIRHFIKQSNRQLNRSVKGIDTETEEILMNYSWPGNLRELQNVIRRSVLMARADTIDKSCLPHEIVFPESINGSQATDGLQAQGNSGSMLKDASSGIEKQLIVKAIQDAGYNKSKAARMLKIDRKTLYNKIKLYGIEL
jgi:two-component system response regulator HydG